MEIDYDKFIDATDLKCPQPLLLAKAAIQEVQTKQIVLLQSNDAHTDLDLEVWCQRFGHEIICKNENKGLFWIKKCQN